MGGKYHAELLRNALAEYNLPPLLAWTERSVDVLTERHLGLKMLDESMIPDYSSALHVNHIALVNAFLEVTHHTHHHST